MATERLSMRKTREILRLKWLGRRHRDIRRSTGASLGKISDVATRARAAGVDELAAATLTEDELEAKLFPPAPRTGSRPLPDPAYLDLELRRPGVTLRLLHEEYLVEHADGFGCTQFCRHYGDWLARRR